MALSEAMTQPEQGPPEQGGQQDQPLTPDQEMDLKIGVLLGERLLHEGGFKAIQTAVDKSSDPGQAVGSFLLQMGQQMMESMPSEVKLSPIILLCRGGWLEQISDYIQEKLGVSKEIMDKAEIFVASTAHQMAAAKQQKGGGAIDGIDAPPVAGPGTPQVEQQGPPMPQQGGM